MLLIGDVMDQLGDVAQPIMLDVVELGPVDDHQLDAVLPAIIGEAMDGGLGVLPSRLLEEIEIGLIPFRIRPGQAEEAVHPAHQEHHPLGMAAQPVVVFVFRNRDGAAEVEIEHDDVGLEFRIPGEEALHLLDRTVIADPGVHDLDLAAGVLEHALQPLGDRLVEGHAPALDEGIAQHDDARHAGLALDGIFMIAVADGVRRHIDPHQMGLGEGAVLMADERIGRALLHVAGVFPHLEIEIHPIVDEEANPQLEQPREHHHRDQQGQHACEQIRPAFSSSFSALLPIGLGVGLPIGRSASRRPAG